MISMHEKGKITKHSSIETGFILIPSLRNGDGWYFIAGQVVGEALTID
jgi:hypothetical protein